LDSAQTVADYQYAVAQLNIWVNNFSAYKTNFGSSVAYNRVHATDIQLMQKYGDMGNKTIVISLSEQAVRVYQNGKLVKAFLVVTGMPGHPSLPGSWWVETHDKNLTFKSGLKPGQPGYYPPTPIAYALQYHSSGYYLHESWWRSQYGPGNQFPHNDPNGTAFAFEGSHGCVNISTANIKWLYNFAAVNSTKIIIYESCWLLLAAGVGKQKP
ncbi:MAG TPA: L,D-transpeptidase, partial [Ktedonobacteraceae bacterium]|nr:L,D-transpeptidase [Ktedonobacteraceae bacterium]